MISKGILPTNSAVIDSGSSEPEYFHVLVVRENVNRSTRRKTSKPRWYKPFSSTLNQDEIPFSCSFKSGYESILFTSRMIASPRFPYCVMGIKLASNSAFHFL